MVNINIHIPDELHKELKLEAVKVDSTLKDLIINTSDKSSKGGIK